MLTLPNALEGVVRHNGPRTAVVDAAGVATWREFRDRVARAAAVVAEQGVAPGARFGIMARNSVCFDEIKWGGLWAGTVPVPVNWRFAPPEIAHVLSDSGCEAVFVEDAFLQAFDAEELAPWRERLVVLPDTTSNRRAGYQTLMARAAPAAPHQGHEDDDALILYTGGTTGRSKGVRISHRNVLSNGVAFGHAVGARRDDVYMHTAPMFHSADLLATGWLLQGAAQCYLPVFSPEAFMAAIQDYRVTATVTVPTMLMMLVSDPAFGTYDLTSLRLLIYGAAPMALEWIRRVAAAFPDIEFCNSYGLTETAPDLTVFNPREFRAAIESGAHDGPVRSVGKPNALNELRVVGADGAALPPGEIGELWARGPNITKGYWNLPDETASNLVDGWLRTGDLASIDQDGYVYLHDRVKDMVISGGENIYSSEVEAALYRHPSVQECAVIGVPDDRLGEALFAVIVPVPGNEPTDAELIDHCRSLIAGYKIPRRMAFVETMPKSAMGKILKTELRKQYGG